MMTGRGRDLLKLIADEAYDENDDYHLVTTKKCSDYTLAKIYGSEEYGGKIEIAYQYDFGDGWEHQIVFLGRTDPSARKTMRLPDNWRVLCLAGEVRMAISQPQPAT